MIALVGSGTIKRAIIDHVSVLYRIPEIMLRLYDSHIYIISAFMDLKKRKENIQKNCSHALRSLQEAQKRPKPVANYCGYSQVVRISQNNLWPCFTWQQRCVGTCFKHFFVSILKKGSGFVHYVCCSTVQSTKP